MNEETSGHGTVEGSFGPLINLRFSPQAIPPLFARLDSGPDSLCVVRVQTDGFVQAIPTRTGSIWVPGQGVNDSGRPFLGAITDRVASEVIQSPHYGTTPLFTGIKTIDVFAPLVQGGQAGVFAEWGVGLLVLLPEMVMRLDKSDNRQAIYAFVPPIQDDNQWQEVNAELTVGSKSLEIYYVPVEDPLTVNFASQLSNLDAKLVLSRALAEQGVYPSIDPVRSSSQFQDAGRSRVASGVCKLIERYFELQFSSGPESKRRLQPEEWLQVRRARLAIKFLSQPFYVAEPYTGIPGLDADVGRAAQTFAGILSGEYDALKWDSFSMTGDSPKQK